MQNLDTDKTNKMIKNKLYCTLLFILIIFSTSCNNEDSPEEIIVPVTVDTQNMNFSIDENPNENQLIGTIIGTTNQGNIQFAINEQNPTNSFTIDSSTGELFVDNTSIYDYETITEITGKIKVFNGSVTSESVVTISINDIVEDVFNGSILLKNQDEVDAFALNSYRVITGTLEIVQGDDSGTPITDLSNLNSIEDVQGNLLIAKNNELTNLNGLNNLKNAVLCSIWNNPNLEDISALQNILDLNNISLDSNPKITSLSCFSNIQEVSSISIFSNNGLIDLQGLHNITSVNSLWIDDNVNLTTIDLNSLTTINGQVNIANNESLLNLDALNNLHTVTGGIYLLSNNNLDNVDGLQNLSSFSNKFYLNGKNLSNIDGLKSLTHVKLIQIGYSDLLQNLNGLANLVSVDESLLIVHNPSLNDLCGITSLINNNFSGGYNVSNNLYNPTIEDIINGNCSN